MTKKIIFIFSLLLLAGCSLFEPKERKIIRQTKEPNLYNKTSDDSVPRSRLMVLPFLDASSTRAQDIRDRARKVFLAELNKSGEVIAIGSEEVKYNFDEALKKGEYNLSEISKQAQNLGVTALLEGKIMDLRIKKTMDSVGLVRKTKMNFDADLRVRIVNVRTGKELMNTMKTVSLEESEAKFLENTSNEKATLANPELVEAIIRDAFLDFIPQINKSFAKITWEGRIAAVSGDRIYLNVGRVSGLQIGDLLKVTDEGDDIYDPESGSYIGRVPGRIKGTIEVISYFGNDGAIAVLHSGSGFKENDRVEVYQ